MKRFLLSAVVLSCIGLNAQVGINTEEGQIARDAVFHVKNKTSEKKGVILPTVSLNTREDILNSGSGNSDGLMIWNDGAGELKDTGYYYWKEDTWVKVGSEGAVYQNVRVVKSTLFTANGILPNDYLLVFTDADGFTMPAVTTNYKERTLCIRNATALPFGTGAKQIVMSGVIAGQETINPGFTRCYTSFKDTDNSWKWISTSF